MRTWRPWTDDDEANLLRLLDEGMDYAAIGPQLNRTVPAVKERARLLGRCKVKPPNWTKAEENELEELLDRHWTYAAIARRLGRTEMAIVERLLVIGGEGVTRRGYSANKVSKIMGVDSHTVTWWINQGWLRAHRTGAMMRHGEVRVVDHEDLTAFLEDPDYWHHWTPERIRDTGLREWATELRAGVRFLTTGQAADVLCLTHYAVNQLIRHGRIRAQKSGANWLIRSDQLSYELKPQGPHRDWTDEDRAFVRDWWGKRPATWIANKLDRASSSVCALAYRLGLPRVGRGIWKKKVAA